MIRNLDNKDILIMWELSKNSRQPIAKIAKKVKVPKETVNYRIEQLVKLGVITKFYAIADSSIFGLSFTETYIKLKGIPKDVEEECIQKLQKHPYMCWLVTTSGRFNLLCTFLTKNRLQFYECYNYIRLLFGDYLKELEFNLPVEGDHFTYPFFKNFNQSSIKVLTPRITHESPKLDGSQIKLLQFLTDNSRMSIRNISIKLGITEKTARSKIKWLEKNRYIHSYTTLIHPGRVGYFFYVMLIKLKFPDPNLETYLKNIPEIFFLVKGIGFIDLKVEFYTNSEKRIYEIEEELYQKFNNSVIQIDILHIKKEHGVRYFVDA